MRRFAAALTGCMLLAAGCVSKPSASLHSRHSDQMRLVMHEMNGVIYERLKSELERDDDRRRYAFRLADMIETLSTQIAPLAASEEGFGLSGEALETFKAYAAELQSQGEQVRVLAEAYRLDEIDPVISRMVQTCNRCHHRFDVGPARIE